MNRLTKILFLIAFPFGAFLFESAFCDTADDLTKSGNQKFSSGDFVGALADSEKVVQLKPDKAVAYYNRAIARNAAMDLDGAIADYTKAVQLEPGLSPAYNNRGKTKTAKGDFDGALVDYDKTIQLNPNDARAYYNRGDVKMLKKDFDGALIDYDKGVELRPDVDGFYSRGVAKQMRGDADGALADLNKAIDLDPNFKLAYYNRGMVRKLKHDFGGALTDLSKAIQLKFDDGRVSFGRAYARYDSRDFKGALADFRKAIELNASYDYGHLMIWLVRARLGEKTFATDELQANWKNRKAGAPKDWSPHIARFLTGQLAENDFLNAAINIDKQKEKEQRCEAYFFAGSKRLIEGDSKTAKHYFDKCVATGLGRFAEYQSAEAELKFLQTQ